MSKWTVEESEKLRQIYGKVSPKELEKTFGRNYQAIWLHAKKMGIAGGGKGRKASVLAPNKHHWTTEELEKLYALTQRMADPKEIAQAFPGIPWDEIIAEAERTACDICYLKNREVIRKSIDVEVMANVILNVTDFKINFLK